MPFRVSGKNIDIGEALRTRINAAHRRCHRQVFRRRLFRPCDDRQGGLSAFARNASIHLDSGIVLEAEALAADAYASADQAALRIEKRLRRYKRRLKDHQAARVDGQALEPTGEPRSMRRATSSPRPSTTATRRSPNGTRSSSPNRRPR